MLEVNILSEGTRVKVLGTHLFNQNLLSAHQVLGSVLQTEPRTREARSSLSWGL